MSKEIDIICNLGTQRDRGLNNIWPGMDLEQLRQQYERETRCGSQWDWDPVQIWVGRGFFDLLRKRIGEGSISIQEAEQNIQFLWLRFLTYLIELLKQNKVHAQVGNLEMSKTELIKAMWYLNYWMLEDNLTYPGLPALFELTYILSRDVGFKAESILGWDQMKQEIVIKYRDQLKMKGGGFILNFDQPNQVWELKELGIKIERVKGEGGKVKWEIDLIEEDDGSIGY